MSRTTCRSASAHPAIMRHAERGYISCSSQKAPFASRFQLTASTIVGIGVRLGLQEGSQGLIAMNGDPQTSKRISDRGVSREAIMFIVIYPHLRPDYFASRGRLPGTTLLCRRLLLRLLRRPNPNRTWWNSVCGIDIFLKNLTRQHLKLW
jgi:hypothetical protein